MNRAITSWLATLAIALGIGAILQGTGLVIDEVIVGLCLTTTALGTLLPILRDSGVLKTSFGPTVLSVGSIGEFGPIVAVAVVLTNPRRQARRSLLLGGVRRGCRRGRPAWPCRCTRPASSPYLQRHLDSSSQLPVRISVTLVVFLVYLTLKLSLDVLLGAFAAGVVVRLFIRGENSEQITSKLEAIGFGFLIPIFFIESGINFDLHALIHVPKDLLLVPLFTVLFLVTRGLPTFLFFRRSTSSIGGSSSKALTVLSARRPCRSIGRDHHPSVLQEHRMRPQIAAAPTCRGHAVRPHLPDPRAPPGCPAASPRTGDEGHLEVNDDL